MVLLLQSSQVDMPHDYGVSSVANLDTPSSFVELGRIVTKGTTVTHLNNTIPKRPRA